MTISQAKTGAIVETLHFGVPSGNLYRLAEPAQWGDYVYAWRPFRQGKIRLAGWNKCRVLNDYEGSF